VFSVLLYSMLVSLLILFALGGLLLNLRYKVSELKKEQGYSSVLFHSVGPVSLSQW
jgi:hypothetical protein